MMYRPVQGGALQRASVGAPIKGNAFANAASNIPQASLLSALLGHGAATKPTSLYQQEALVVKEGGRQAIV